MKKILFTFMLLVSQMLTVWGQDIPERYDFDVKVFNDANDQFVYNSKLSIWLDNNQINVMIKPLPNAELGFVLPFSYEYDSSMELVKAGDVNGVILSHTAFGERIFLENSIDNNSNREFLFIYKKNSQGEPVYKPYYIELTEDQGLKFRVFCVVNNSKYRIFKNFIVP